MALWRTWQWKINCECTPKADNQGRLQPHHPIWPSHCILSKDFNISGKDEIRIAQNGVVLIDWTQETLLNALQHGLGRCI